MQFSNEDTKRIQSFYQDLLKKHGRNNPRSLNWNSEYSQKMRFPILSQVSTLEHCTILDVGCGLGDLYEYLFKTVKTFHYSGIDIVPEMVDEAKKRFPGVDFRVFDFSKDMNVNETFDYVLSSGALSYKIENSKKKYFAMIKRMFDISKKGVAFNVLDKSKHSDDDSYASYSPVEIYEYCSGFTNKLTLRHDYLDYDFTLYLYH